MLSVGIWCCEYKVWALISHTECYHWSWCVAWLLGEGRVGNGVKLIDAEWAACSTVYIIHIHRMSVEASFHGDRSGGKVLLSAPIYSKGLMLLGEFSLLRAWTGAFGQTRGDTTRPNIKIHFNIIEKCVLWCSLTSYALTECVLCVMEWGNERLFFSSYVVLCDVITLLWYNKVTTSNVFSKQHV